MPTLTAYTTADLAFLPSYLAYTHSCLLRLPRLQILLPYLPTYLFASQYYTTATPMASAIVTDGQDRWPHGLDAQQDDVNESDLKDFITFKIEEYTFYDFKNISLWEAFTDDFNIFTVDSFKISNQNTVRKLRDFLRYKGV